MKRAQRIESLDVHLDDVIQGDDPVVLAGAARDWPLVDAGLQSADDAIAYLLEFDAGREVLRYQGPAKINGRFAYNETLTGFNFAADRMPLAQAFGEIKAAMDQDEPHATYIGSTDVSSYLPGLLDDNGVSSGDVMSRHSPPMVSIWMGNRTVAAAHYDLSDNLVCNMVGRRRFTLFPPDQVANLYPGPLERTPGGQVISLVDFRDPDLQRYPRAAEALEHAILANLAPGDMLYYPGMWWHQVEALDSFNVMINYWWNRSPDFYDSPDLTLWHALLSLRGRPQREKDAWKSIFDHYIFGDRALASDHLPLESRGALGELDPGLARRLRATILKRINR
ncbi:MAG: cupin-like domain-containing protein [Pseudomonadota bacterium]